MLKKVHLRLTLLCTAITGGIIIIITVIYLLVSESNMKASHFLAFQNDMQNVVSSLGNSDVITGHYLSSLEAGGRYYVFVEDNGSPLLYGNIVESREQQERQALLAAVKEYYASHLRTESVPGPFRASHTEFIYRPAAGSAKERSPYYACAAVLPKLQGGLEIYILASTADFYGQLTRQRLSFAAVNLAALLVLYCFFYFFTSYLLRPVRENQEKQTRFIASASHELRTPLSVILSCASLIPESENARDKEQYCATIREEGSTMKRLLDEMLMLAGSDSHTLTVSITENEPDTLVLNSVEAFEPPAKEKGLRLTVELPQSPLAPCLFDRDRMAQVLSILLHNAISYTPCGGTVSVTLRALPRGHFLISVADTGIGVPDEDKKRIFERFYRADPSHSKKDHFGLGLSIAREIIREHHGSLTVSDTPGGGATFTVRL